ncbi:PB1 domain-containing protein/Pkinase_Tyr domain-containing protein [Cephalotus follicularis]|uniref:PB1 domain-containing protein/Pkinase_Tyr domain-containing protein n=1 Tax=Cephalotus follicularis TaxID=3775 RepID=A0A1Q3BH41_CEPFO|nr:PB1 domain-containing protein/Pkinase_Tyr domain-containing protein [Cephalotus follicularis]
MERNLGKGAVDQHRNYEQVRYNNVETKNEGLVPANQGVFHDPSSNINTNIRPPDYNMLAGARPVLNFSIQTGEEFALEFMRERVNPRQHFIPNAYGDPNGAPAYIDLKGMLGISHSESGSHTSMHNTVEQGHTQESERMGSSAHEDKSYYDSVRSVPRSSSRNDASRDGSTKLKFLCSFGGKILPRPSDGKLRYVGGETHIIRITRDISWEELKRKMMEIYNQTHAIKYQLPGEDLDALVSVSCDEDLQNMMDECNVLEGGGSQKPRMFLFSYSDLEDAQFSLGSMEGDSEIQFVVAVNGIDLGSRKNSIGLASTSGNNLDELLSLTVERESGQVVAESVGARTSALLPNAPSSTIQSPQPFLGSSSGAYESDSQLYQGQKMHQEESGQNPLYSLHQIGSFSQIDGKSTSPLPVPLQHGYGSHPPDYAVTGENLVTMPVHAIMAQHGSVASEQMDYVFYAQDSDISAKEVKLKRNSSTHKINEPEKIRSLDKEVPIKELKMRRDGSLPKINEDDDIRKSENENTISLHPYDGSVPNYISREEESVANSAADIGYLLPTKSNKLNQEPVLSPLSPEAVNEGRTNNDEDHYYTSSGPFTSGYGGSEPCLTDYSYLEPSEIPQRVFHSERIPREQAEMNRLSKSDDSFGSQFLVSQARSDHSQPIAELVDKFYDGNVSFLTEQQSTASVPLHTIPYTVEDGLGQFKKHKEIADKISKINYNISETGLESNLHMSESRLVGPSLSDHELAPVKENYKDISAYDKEAAGLNQGTSGKHLGDSAMRSSNFEWSEMTNNGNDTKGHGQSSAWMENPVVAVSREESAVNAGTSEQGDIVIDINDRFPRDFLSDIFTKARISENLSVIIPLHGDGAGLSLNMENHEPKHWSYFRNLAQNEFVRKDVSLMDQDHLGFSSLLSNIEEGAPLDYSYPPLKSDVVALGHIDSQINFNEDIRREPSLIIEENTMDLHPDYSHSPIKDNESVLLDGGNPRIPGSDYEDRRLENQNTNAPLVDLPLANFDITTLQIIKNEDLEELRELGSGTFGTVYHGKWRGTDVAIKRIKKSCFTGRSSEQERLTVEFWREAEILSKLHHPNVVAFYGVVQDGPGGTLATVTEFMVNGSLRHVLLSKDRHLDRRKRLIIAMDAAFGMEYLHSKNIVHFDLKCDNLLVNLKDPARPICKVGDFGLSKIKRNTLVTGGVRGTLPWMAPELLNGGSSKVSEKVDVFSFGIVLWEILTGEEPYANMHYGAIIGGIVNNTLRPPVPSFCDHEWRFLMEQCWAPDPVGRPSFTEITRRLRIMSTACQTKPHSHQLQNQGLK